ncbi:MAG: hypothetical protein JXQ96_06950 [Cyclobacteriaceae bacterium]
MSIAFNNIRTHNKYRLTNFGEVYEFVVLEIFPRDEFKLKDIHTLEVYYLSTLISQGKGKDFSIWEI